jgi:HK97 gp10 family phage protein
MANAVQGGSAVRRKLSKISQYADKPLKAVLEEVSQVLVDDIKARVPVDTGELRESIEYNISSDGLTAVVGPAVKSGAVRKATKGSGFNTEKVNWGKIRKGTKDKLWQVTKAYWVEFGTKGHKVQTQIKSALADKQKGEFFGKTVDVPAMPARPFINPAYEAHKDTIKSKVASAFNKMLEDVARGN